VIEVGKKAPAFQLPDQDGKPVSLKDFAGRTVVLYFYPKALTPGCTQESCDFQSALARIKRKGAVVLGMSRDPVAKQAKFAEKHALKFPLLSDEDGKVCGAYGVWQEKTLYGRKFMGIVRATFLIGPDGRVRAVFPKVKVAGHVDEVLAAL
jgi:peroxiredoxin Q/BCP